jgi:hypothetical protein
MVSSLYQCIIPCIEGLLPAPLEKIVLDLLWELALWHGLAKLCLHTESTLNVLEATTSNLGAATRQFEKSCRDIDTRELPWEIAARIRRDAKTASTGAANHKGKQKATGPKQKVLNLKTFKWHAIGHLPHFIRRHGTSESYSTQVVSFLEFQSPCLALNYIAGLGRASLSTGVSRCSTSARTASVTLSKLQPVLADSASFTRCVRIM